jgi:sulfofructose kinase
VRPRLEAADVIGVGYCSWDYLGIVPHIPAFDSPTLTIKEFATSGGGPVATALVTLARLGARVGYVGSVGDDEAGRDVAQAFDDAGVDISRLRVDRGARSAVCMVLVQEDTGSRTILCYRGTRREVSLQDEDRPYVASARFLHLDGHHMEAALTASQWMEAAGGTVVLDANKPRERLGELLPHVDVLIANARFPQLYTGVDNPQRAAAALLAAGPRLVVTTLGPDGCYCRWPEGEAHEAGFQVPVVDTTGAGDAFHGAFIFGLLQGWPIPRTACFANAVAALNCAALGGRAGLPTLNQALIFLTQSGRWGAAG